MLGKTLSHYRILEKLGEGGMGEVYRAEDTTLKREVAIKVLPEQFTQDPQRLARFEREAQLLASLNHPNIAAIHSFEHADGLHFLVLELVEGETLAERVAKGPLPVEEALEVCRQIAEGVEAAHEKGVIHRDLKPANVKITPEGMVKILDFGLAKALEGETPITDISQSPTLTDAMTGAGVILGTAAYMSPEQARGEHVDRRTDIWAFGAVLYEMLTGRQVFAGPTVSDSLAKVLESTPDFNALPPQTPSAIRRLVRRCLEKDRTDRLQHIGDARVEVKEALTTPTTEVGAEISAVLQSVGWRRAIPLIAAGLVMGILVTGLGLWNIRSASIEPPLRKFTLLLPGLLTQFDTLAVSPDGQMVAYTRNGQLWIQHLDQLEPLEILDSDGARLPFWSPHSDFVGYLAGGSLRKVSAEGGPSALLCDVPGWFMGGTWGSSGTIILAQLGLDLSQVSDQGGESQLFMTPDSTEIEQFQYPHFLPDGGSLLFHIVRADGSGEIVVQSGETRTPIVSVPNIDGLTYSPSGHILYGRGGFRSEGIWAIPFSLESLAPTGAQFRVADNGSLPSVSADGTLVYGVLEDRQQLVWVNRNGEVEGTIGGPSGPDLGAHAIPGWRSSRGPGSGVGRR
ncbi:serine/threonine protein kinase [Acidobacteria bacterium AH-259-O06]|nr:serine/threonine protein kinase [Acidobacteria bacterium AH-259-O06]